MQILLEHVGRYADVFTATAFAMPISLYSYHKTFGSTQQTFVSMKTSWKRLEDLFRLHLPKTSLRRLQEVLIKTNIFLLIIRLQKTPWRLLQEVFKTSWWRLQDVFKTFSRHVGKTSLRRLQDVLKKSWKNVFKTSLRRLQDVFKTYSRRLAKTPSRLLENVFRTFHKYVLKTSKTPSRRFQDVSSS